MSMIRAILAVAIVAVSSLLSAQQLAIGSIPGSCNDGDIITYNTANNGLRCKPPVSSALASGSILLIDSGTCPSGTTEDVGLDGVTLFGTLAAHGDVGTTGGSDSLIPAGTVSQPTFTGNAVASDAVSAGTPSGTVSVPVFTGSALGTHIHGIGSYAAAAQVFTGASTTVPAETVAVLTAAAQTVSSLSAASQTFSGTPSSCVANHVHIETINSAITGSTGNGFPALLDSSTSGGPTSLWMSTANNTGGTATCTYAGTNGTSAVTGTMNSSAVAGTLNSTSLTPLGSNASSAVTGSSEAVSAGTPAGTNSTPTFTGSALATHQHTTTAIGIVSQPTFAGNSADNRSAFKKVIFCKAN